MTKASDQIVAAYLIGGSGDSDATRRVNWPVLRAGGWERWISENVPTALAWGAKRLHVHQPWGQTSGELMQLDAFVHARDGVAGKHGPLRWLTDNFAAAWTPVTSMPGVTVDAYVGSLRDDPDFLNMPFDKAVTRFAEALKPALDAKMGVVFDEGVNYTRGSREWAAVDHLRSYGVRVGFEGRPKLDNQHVLSERVYMTNGWFEKSDPAREPNPWAVPNERLAGEVVILLNDAPTGKSWADPTWYGAELKRYVDAGFTVAVNVTVALRVGVSRKSLTGCN
jgi:hypothetical protein